MVTVLLLHPVSYTHLVAHSRKTLSHELFHEAMTGILRIRANTCDKAHLVALAVYINIERIYRKLSNTLFSFVNDIEAAEHISSLKHRNLRLLDFVILPACLGQVCLCQDVYKRQAFAAAMISSSVASGFPIMILSRIVPFLSHVS